MTAGGVEWRDGRGVGRVIIGGRSIWTGASIKRREANSVG